MKNKGLLIVVSGPSGAGKGTVVGSVVETNKQFKLSISVTTRLPREGEVDGVNYYFKTMPEFEQMIHNKDLLEYMDVYGNFYGTNKYFVEEMLEKGYDVILEIDTKGALAVKKIMPNAVMIFITPISLGVLTKRLVGRRTETPEQIDRRLGESVKEIKHAVKYDYIVVNDELDVCVNQVANIIISEHCRAKRCLDVVENFR